MGSHSIKAGGLFNRNLARDGFGIGVNNRGLYDFNGSATGNAFADFLLGDVSRRASDQYTARGPLDGHSDDFALFAQDDWRVNNDLTVFLGLRYELVGMWHENSNLLANFVVADGGHHVVPNAQVAADLPPGLQDLNRTLIASQAGYPDTLVNADKNNFSPRVGFAWRPGGNDKTVVRGGFGLFHPTVAVQGVRDLLATNEFRYTESYTGGPLQHAFSQGAPYVDPTAFGNQGIDPNLQSPDIYQYNLTLEREIGGNMGVRLSYIGSTMRKLLTDTDYNTLAPNTDFFDPNDAESYTRLPYYPYGTYMDIVQNKGEGQLHALQASLTRRWRDGLAFDLVYTYAHSDTTVPDSGNATIGVVLYDPRNPMGDRGPDPNVVKHRFVANATWDIPVGKSRKYGSSMPGWADALFGGWTASTIFQARSGLNLTPYFYGFTSTSPWNTAKALDGLGNCFSGCWRPDVTGNPNQPQTRDQWFNQTAYSLPAPGQFGNAKKGTLTGPGTWVVNFSIYKDVIAKDKFRLQFTALLDNAFNHPQFFPGYNDTFTDMNDYLANGIANNGVTAVLGRRRHRQRGGLRARESVPPRHKSDVLASKGRRGARSFPRERAPRRRRFFPARRRLMSAEPRPGLTPCATRTSSRSCLSRPSRRGRRLRPRTSSRTWSCSGPAARWGPRWRAGSRAPSTKPACRAVSSPCRASPSRCDASRPRAGRRRDDLLRPARAVRRSTRLPDAPNVLFLAGRKFGATRRPGAHLGASTRSSRRTWRAATRERASSSSRPATSTRSSTPTRGGCDERDATAPVGEYAQSCLGRERVFEHYSRASGHPVPARSGSSTRSTCATARSSTSRAACTRAQPVDLVAWPASTRSGRATRNSYAIRALALCETPPRPLERDRPEHVLPVRRGRRALRRVASPRSPDSPVLRGRSRSWATPRAVPPAARSAGASRPTGSSTWVADWVAPGGRILGKPTRLRGGRWPLLTRHGRSPSASCARRCCAGSSSRRTRWRSRPSGGSTSAVRSR